MWILSVRSSEALVPSVAAFPALRPNNWTWENHYSIAPDIVFLFVSIPYAAWKTLRCPEGSGGMPQPLSPQGWACACTNTVVAHGASFLFSVITLSGKGSRDVCSLLQFLVTPAGWLAACHDSHNDLHLVRPSDARVLGLCALCSTSGTRRRHKSPPEERVSLDP
jgi:hypothetical protein